MLTCLWSFAAVLLWNISAASTIPKAVPKIDRDSRDAQPSIFLEKRNRILRANDPIKTLKASRNQPRIPLFISYAETAELLMYVAEKDWLSDHPEQIIPNQLIRSELTTLYIYIEMYDSCRTPVVLNSYLSIMLFEVLSVIMGYPPEPWGWSTVYFNFELKEAPDRWCGLTVISQTPGEWDKMHDPDVSTAYTNQTKELSALKSLDSNATTRSTSSTTTSSTLDQMTNLLSISDTGQSGSSPSNSTISSASLSRPGDPIYPIQADDVLIGDPIPLFTYIRLLWYASRDKLWYSRSPTRMLDKDHKVSDVIDLGSKDGYNLHVKILTVSVGKYHPQYQDIGRALRTLILMPPFEREVNITLVGSTEGSRIPKPRPVFRFSILKWPEMPGEAQSFSNDTGLAAKNESDTVGSSSGHHFDPGALLSQVRNGTGTVEVF